MNGMDRAQWAHELAEWIEPQLPDGYRVSWSASGGGEARVEAAVYVWAPRDARNNSPIVWSEYWHPPHRQWHSGPPEKARENFITWLHRYGGDELRDPWAGALQQGARL